MSYISPDPRVFLRAHTGFDDSPLAPLDYTASLTVIERGPIYLSRKDSRRYEWGRLRAVWFEEERRSLDEGLMFAIDTLRMRVESIDMSRDKHGVWKIEVVYLCLFPFEESDKPIG
jgi:hypothetical protein